MKIIQVMPEFGLGGAEIMCENLAYGLKKEGHSVIVISLFDYHSAITDRLEAAGIDVRYLDKKPGPDFSMIIKLYRIFESEKPHAVHTHRHVTQYAVPAAILAGVKCRIHTIHSVAEKENGKIGRMFNKLFFKCCNVIPVALSELVRNTIEKEYAIKKEDIPVIFNGIDLTKCKVKEDYEINGKFKVIHVGRFAEAKNHKCLLEAFRLFHGKYPNSVLKLIGDGEKRKEIEDYIANNKLTDSVILYGVKNRVYEYLHDADIFTLPSLYEGIPMSLIEAMGTGLPIVATAVGGIPDMLDKNNALLTAVEPTAVCDAFEEYYTDKNLRQQHGKNARQSSHEFSVEIMAKKYIELYVANR